MLNSELDQRPRKRQRTSSVNEVKIWDLTAPEEPKESEEGEIETNVNETESGEATEESKKREEDENSSAVEVKTSLLLHQFPTGVAKVDVMKCFNDLLKNIHPNCKPRKRDQLMYIQASKFCLINMEENEFEAYQICGAHKFLRIAGKNVPLHNDLVPYSFEAARTIDLNPELPNAKKLERIKAIIEQIKASENGATKRPLLSDHIYQHFANTRPSEAEIRMKGFLQDFLENCLLKTFNTHNPSPTLRLYGSSACGLASSGSDIDLGIQFHANSNEPRDQNYILRSLMRMIRNHECTSAVGTYRLRIQPILGKSVKVPILKITDPTYGINADVSIWRGQGVVSDLITKFCSCDKRVRPFLIAVKYWSKVRKMNDASQQKINSFGYVLLALKFLQLLEILPVDIRQTNPKSWHTLCRASIGELLSGFFEFYGLFPFDSHQVTLLRKGIELKKPSIFDVRPDQTVMLIQDPIETRNNVARNVRQRTLKQIQNEFKRAHDFCLKQDWTTMTASVAEHWVSSGPMNGARRRRKRSRDNRLVSQLDWVTTVTSPSGPNGFGYGPPLVDQGSQFQRRSAFQRRWHGERPRSARTQRQVSREPY